MPLILRRLFAVRGPEGLNCDILCKELLGLRRAAVISHFWVKFPGAGKCTGWLRNTHAAVRIGNHLSGTDVVSIWTLRRLHAAIWRSESATTDSNRDSTPAHLVLTKLLASSYLTCLKYSRKSKRGALRLEANLSTQPPAPGKNARLSNSHENSGGAQCFAAPPSEEPSSFDSLKSSFDLSSIPQDFSAATPKRVSAGLRRRAAPQRLTMHGLLPAQRLTLLTPGNHYASTFRDSGPPQPAAAAGARSLSFESREPAGRVGHPGESSRGRGQSLLCHASKGTPAGLSASASASTPVNDDREGPLGANTGAGAFHTFLQLRSWTMAGAVKFLALGLIRTYQLFLSPLLLPACRHYPTCSAYAAEAIDKWGVWKGGKLALGRLLRCRPWGSFGYDPVPEKRGLANYES